MVYGAGVGYSERLARLPKISRRDTLKGKADDLRRSPEHFILDPIPKRNDDLAVTYEKRACGGVPEVASRPRDRRSFGDAIVRRNDCGAVAAAQQLPKIFERYRGPEIPLVLDRLALVTRRRVERRTLGPFGRRADLRPRRATRAGRSGCEDRRSGAC